MSGVRGGEGGDRGVPEVVELAYQGEYLALMESLRRGEVLALERWGKGRRRDGGEVRTMQMLRRELECLWVGFGE